MSEKYFKGYVIVLGLDAKEENAMEELRILRDNLVKVTTDFELLEKQKEVFILINMEPFNVVSSNFFGDIGAILEVEQIRLIGLCGMQRTVKRIAKRMNVVREGRKENIGADTENDDYKIKAFDSLEQGFSTLIST